MLFRIVLFLLGICLTVKGVTQCSTLGQYPASAFPICGTAIFNQNTVPICNEPLVPISGCGQYQGVNPFFYKFTCYKFGTLEFLITPNDLGDDYDWQIFDVTNAIRPDDIFTDPTLFVEANWSGTYGKTGAAVGNPALVVCASVPGKSNPFSKPVLLQQGHKYILLVSHYTNSQSGYSLSFGGGTAVITDTTQPAIVNANANCGGTEIGVHVSKSVLCSSLAADGSDFTLSSALAKITGVYSTNCSTGFDMDSMVLALDKPLPPGTYTVYSKRGGDGNTLLDACGNELPPGDSAQFTVEYVPPTPFDSIMPVTPCMAKELTLFFDKKIKCSSIAADGSDFIVTGPQAVTVERAKGDCNNNSTTQTITITLLKPILAGGNYQVELVEGNDGNTIIDECSQQTPAGQTVGFTTSSAVSAAFNVQVKLGCTQDTVQLYHDGANGVTKWDWLFDDGVAYNTQNVTRLFSNYGDKSVSLQVSNGTCSDSATQTFTLNNQLKARFSSPPQLCPEDKAVFTDSSIGKVTAWAWNFGNGAVSGLQNPPPQQYPFSSGDKYYAVKLIVSDSAGCLDTALYNLKVLYTCYIAVPTAFTPNGDGINDYLYPLSAYKAKNLEFRIFNRWGQQLFETKDWTNRWDGTFKGSLQPAGVYVWFLNYTNIDTNQKYSLKGTSVLIR